MIWEAFWDHLQKTQQPTGFDKLRDLFFMKMRIDESLWCFCVRPPLGLDGWALPACHGIGYENAGSISSLALSSSDRLHNASTGDTHQTMLLQVSKLNKAFEVNSRHPEIYKTIWRAMDGSDCICGFLSGEGASTGPFLVTDRRRSP